MSSLLDFPLYPPSFVIHNSYIAIFLYSAKYKYSAKYNYIFLQHPAFLGTEYIIIPQNTYFQLFFPQNTELTRFFFRKVQNLSNKFRILQILLSTRIFYFPPQNTNFVSDIPQNTVNFFPQNTFFLEFFPHYTDSVLDSAKYRIPQNTISPQGQCKLVKSWLI